MSAPELAPRQTTGGIVAVWAVALVAGIAIAVFVPAAVQPAWFALAMAGCVILSFGVQLAYGRPAGYIRRVAASAVGGLLALGAVSLVVGLVAVFAVV